MVYFHRYILFAGLALSSISTQGFSKSVDLLPAITETGIKDFQFGKTAKEILGSPLSLSLDPGPHGEQFVFKEIKEPRFGFDSLHLGFTMESQRLCNISLVKNFDYTESDAAILGMASNVYGWIKASFGAAVKTDAAFNLHSPPHASYASVDCRDFELKLAAVSRRHDAPMAWLELTMLDKKLIEVASSEYGRLSNDETVKMKVENRKKLFAWFVPILYAALLYLVFCLPVFLVSLVVYLVVMKIRHLKPVRVISWCDPLVLVLAPYLWACLGIVGQTKSLSNIMELAIIGWIWCLCIVVRYGLSAMGNRRFEKYCGVATLVLVLAAAAMLALFFPTLPE